MGGFKFFKLHKWYQISQNITYLRASYLEKNVKLPRLIPAWTKIVIREIWSCNLSEPFQKLPTQTSHQAFSCGFQKFSEYLFYNKISVIEFFRWNTTVILKRH